VIGCLIRYFGDAAGRPEHYVERDWMAEEFTRGCYGAHFAPGVWTSYGEAWREPAGRVHWAGAECAPRWNGYMEGAVRSGEATAEAVAALCQRDVSAPTGSVSKAECGQGGGQASGPEGHPGTAGGGPAVQPGTI